MKTLFLSAILALAAALLWSQQVRNTANTDNLIIWSILSGTGASITGPGVALYSAATGAFRVHNPGGSQGITISADDRADQPVADQPWLRVGGVGHSDLILNSGAVGGKIRLADDLGDGVVSGVDITVEPMAGVGNAYACVDAAGKLYRSAVPCV